MATNRTKIDWAYRQAQKLYRLHIGLAGPLLSEDWAHIRAIAAALRAAYRKGRMDGLFFKSGG